MKSAKVAKVISAMKVSKSIRRQRMQGFSLVELAVVLLILGLLFVGVFSGSGTSTRFSSGTGSSSGSSSGLSPSHTEKKRVAQQLRSLEIQQNIKQQLLQFALVNKYLPCPDSASEAQGQNGREKRLVVSTASSVSAGLEDVAGAEGVEEVEGTGASESAVTFEVCQYTVGRVPYLDLGLTRSEVQDAYGHFIGYAVNRNAANQSPAVICDSEQAASYFCKAIPGVARFALTKTPPTTKEAGTGHYTICNQSTESCDVNSAQTALETTLAAVVLIAFNEDGAKAQAECNLMSATLSAASRENCNGTAYYHQAMKTSVADAFFDDTIVWMTGYEIKSVVLSPVFQLHNVALEPL